PTASDGSKTLNEDAAATAIDLGALVSDLQTTDPNLTHTIPPAPRHAPRVRPGPSPGSPGTAGPSINYTPNANYNGPDSFTYSVTDRGDPDNCGAPSTSCDAAETSAIKTVSITVNPVNDAPTAR